MAVTSFVRDRGRAFGVVAVMAMSVALLSAPSAFGAVDGDPIANSKMELNFSKSFKKQLKNNGVKMNANGFNIVRHLTSDVDPITGHGDLRLGKVIFKLNGKGKRICKSNTSKDQQCKRRVVYNNLKGTLPGNVKSSQSGKLFKLSAPASVERDGYGAKVNGVTISFVKKAAKKINRRLELNSLHKARAGSFSFEYKPETVKILGGTAQTTSQPANLAAPLLGGSVGAKLLLAHCVNGVGAGFQPIAPGEKEVMGLQAIFRFPVIDGEISPDGRDGLSETAGGIRIQKDITTDDCDNGLTGELTQQGITTNITERSVSSEVNIISAPPGVSTGPRGRAVGQILDPTNTVITISPANRTFTLSGSVVQLAPSSATILNLVFPCKTAADCDDNPTPQHNATLFGGDIFGTSQLTVVTR